MNYMYIYIYVYMTLYVYCNQDTYPPNTTPIYLYRIYIHMYMTSFSVYYCMCNPYLPTYIVHASLSPPSLMQHALAIAMGQTVGSSAGAMATLTATLPPASVCVLLDSLALAACRVGLSDGSVQCH